jgi:hypothetical protein
VPLLPKADATPWRKRSHKPRYRGRHGRLYIYVPRRAWPHGARSCDPPWTMQGVTDDGAAARRARVVDQVNKRACGANSDNTISQKAFIYDAIHR